MVIFLLKTNQPFLTQEELIVRVRNLFSYCECLKGNLNHESLLHTAASSQVAMISSIQLKDCAINSSTPRELAVENASKNVGRHAGLPT